MVAPPPTARTNDVGDFVDFTKSVEHVRSGDGRVSIIRVLLCFDGHHQASILKKRDSTIMARVIREDLQAASGLHRERFLTIQHLSWGLLHSRERGVLGTSVLLFG